MSLRPAVGLLAAALAFGLPGPVSVAGAAPLLAQAGAPEGAVAEIGARLRWGGQGGFRGSVFDPAFGPTGQIHQQALNGPPWQTATPYAFEVRFTRLTGELSLAVDFNRNQHFSNGETVTRSVFGAPGPAGYAGESFEALRISVRQSGTARSEITDLVVNGQPMASLAPAAGQSTGMIYLAAGGEAPGDWLVRGRITFFAATAQESPAWDFTFLNLPGAAGAEAPTAVPAPAGLAMLGFGMLGLVAVRRRR